MDPEEESLLAVLLQPLERPVGDHGGAALGKDAGQLPFLGVGAHVIIVSSKAVRQAEAPAQHARAHEGGSRKTRRLGDGSHGGVSLGEHEPAHVAQTVDRGVGAPS